MHINMSLPQLPFLSDYTRLDEYMTDILQEDQVLARRAITSGLTLLAKGWADYLAMRELGVYKMIISDFTCDHMILR